MDWISHRRNRILMWDREGETFRQTYRTTVLKRVSSGGCRYAWNAFSNWKSNWNDTISSWWLGFFATLKHLTKVPGHCFHLQDKSIATLHLFINNEKQKKQLWTHSWKKGARERLTFTITAYRVRWVCVHCAVSHFAAVYFCSVQYDARSLRSSTCFPLLLTWCRNCIHWSNVNASQD